MRVGLSGEESRGKPCHILQREMLDRSGSICMGLWEDFLLKQTSK